MRRWDARGGCPLARLPTPAIPLRRLGGARAKAALLACAQPLRAHEAGHSVLAAAFAQIAQITKHARTAVSAAAARKALRDERSELRIAHPARAGGLLQMRVKPAPADIERIGQRAHRVISVELLHHREALPGTWTEQMPKAFFKI